jgi:hypothetical protein
VAEGPPVRIADRLRKSERVAVGSADLLVSASISGSWYVHSRIVQVDEDVGDEAQCEGVATPHECADEVKMKYGMHEVVILSRWA